MASVLLSSHTLPSRDATAEELEQNLSLSEVLLGVLKSKDKSKRGVIHSSDFQRAITDLGFPLGSAIVQDMLVHCKVDELGDIDFSPLELELQSRRRLAANKPKPAAKLLSTSRAANSATMENIWRAEQDLARRASLEQQAKRVKVYRTELLAIFKRFSHGHAAAADVVEELEALGIMCTRAMMSLLKEQGAVDVNFSAFCSVLTKYDPAETDPADDSIGAGVQTDAKAADLSLRQRAMRRIDHQARIRMQARSDVELHSPTGKNANLKSPDAELFKNSSQIRDQLQMHGGHTHSMLTHNQEQMVSGRQGAVPSVSYNSEIRVQREQVLAALRKLDSGDLSLDEFHTKSNAIGFDIPPALLRLLQENTKVGRLDWRACISILDTTVFKTRALELTASADRLSQIKASILSSLAPTGASALANLESSFRSLELAEAMSLNDFRRGMVKAGVELDEQDLRTLFHSLDVNGDGSVRVQHLVGALRPALANARQCFVRSAFTKLDRFCAGKVAIDDLMEVFDPAFHVDVLRGVKTKRQVVTEMLNALAVLDSDGLVSYERFLNYYSSLSALVDRDEDFVAMIKGCWGVSDKAPPPVVGRQFAGRGLNPHNIEGEGAEGTRGAAANPVTKQHYGDIIGWNQEESWLEQQQSQRKSRDLGLLQAMHARDSDVIGWTKLGQKTAAGAGAGAGTRPGQGLGHGDHAQFDDFRPTGGKRQEFLATLHSNSIKQNLDWTAASKKPKPQAQPEQKAGSSPGGEDEGTRAAGHLTKERHRVRDAGGVRHEGKLNTNTTRHFGGPSPFGVTYEVYQTEFGGVKAASSRSNGGRPATAPKSLSTHLQQKSLQPKSLLDFHPATKQQ